MEGVQKFTGLDRQIDRQIYGGHNCLKFLEKWRGYKSLQDQIYMQIDRQMDRQIIDKYIDGQIDRQKDRQIEEVQKLTGLDRYKIDR